MFPIIMTLVLAFMVAMVFGLRYFDEKASERREQSYAEQSYYKDMCWQEAQRRGYTDKSYLYDFRQDSKKGHISCSECGRLAGNLGG